MHNRRHIFRKTLSKERISTRGQFSFSEEENGMTRQSLIQKHMTYSIPQGQFFLFLLRKMTRQSLIQKAPHNIHAVNLFWVWHHTTHNSTRQSHSKTSFAWNVKTKRFPLKTIHLTDLLSLPNSRHLDFSQPGKWRKKKRENIIIWIY